MAASPKVGDVTVCVYHGKSANALVRTLGSLADQVIKPRKVVVALDCSSKDAAAARQSAGHLALNIEYIDCYNYDAGLAFNALAKIAESELLLFLWSGSELRSEALQALERTAQTSGADVLNFFCRVIDRSSAEEASYLSAPILGSVTEAFFRTDLSPMPVLATRTSFQSVGGFTTDYRVLGCEQEFAARCQVQGLACTTALMEMGSVEAWDPNWIKEKCYDEAVSYFRIIRPQIAAAPLALRDMMLLSKGLQAKNASQKSAGRRMPRPNPCCRKTD